METIVQDYGPIYGEVVNGTVQGRPNGSVYVPISNTISLVFSSDSPTITQNAGKFLGTQSKVVCESQDLASNIVVSVYSDSDCTVLMGKISLSAGVFNTTLGIYANVIEDDLDPGSTYYVRAQLCNNSTAVATSSVTEVTAV